MGGSNDTSVRIKNLYYITDFWAIAAPVLDYFRSKSRIKTKQVRCCPEILETVCKSTELFRNKVFSSTQKKTKTHSYIYKDA